MKKESSRSTKESLRQIAKSRYFPSALGFPRTQKSRLFLHFHTLQIDGSPNHVVSATSNSLENIGGYYPQPSRFRTAGHVSLGSRHPVAGRFPDPRLLPQVLARLLLSPSPPQYRFSLATKKQSIHNRRKRCHSKRRLESIPRCSVQFFRRLIDEARAFPQ